MAIPGLITISNPQNRVKDSYASAPKIDLTVRANGEEKVMVMDAQGSWTVAGFNSPSVAATVSTSATAGSFTAARYWVYSYVYVAKQKYPLVENAQTGGGSPAPRSNPAPMVAANSVTNTNQKILSIPTSSRNDLTHIWIYRTLLDFTTATEALDNGLAGVMFWIGEIENNQNLTSVPFTDPGTDKTGQEQIENDNFSAPLFDKVVYADPYFWGFGNSLWSHLVNIDATGLLTIDHTYTEDVYTQWFDGRNGQTISIEGISTGGYDNHGNFFFKALSNQTAQLYADIALANPVGVSQIGLSTANIRGASTVLYRSKPRNPFSWGLTDLIGDVQVPSIYQFAVGGGEGTGLAIIANQNLLKIDTEKPTRCYTLNLKNAGTPNFEPSLRIISDAFSVSHSHTQFTAVLERGQTVLRSLDTKTGSIIDSDGASQIPVSSQVYRTVKNAAGNSSLIDLTKKSAFPHGIYTPKFELNCIFIWNSGFQSKLVYQHAPTGYWGTIDLFDTICSASVYDEQTSTNKVIVGTSTGLVGQLFADNKWNHWYSGIAHGGCIIANDGTLTTSGSQPTFSGVGLVGNWVTIVRADQTTQMYRIATVANNRTLVFDGAAASRNEDGASEWAYSPSGNFPVAGAATFYIGLIPIEVGRTFNGQIPFDYKKIQEFHTAWRYRTIANKAQTESPTIQFYGTFLPDWSAGGVTIQPLILSNNSEGTTPKDDNYAILSEIPVDIAKSFGIIIRDRNMSETQLMSYEIRLSSLDGNNNQTNRRSLSN